MDETILHEIESLLEEERVLRAAPQADAQSSARLNALETRLDQCWDLLRQRRAKREFGDDPGEAKLRPAAVVERFEN